MLKSILSYLLLCVSFCISAQNLNREVKAIVEVVANEGVFEITAKAENISKVNQSLTYELKVFKEDITTGNKTNNAQTGRFVITSNDIKKLAFTAINSNKNEKWILLLLLRNLDDEIIGKARKVIVDNTIKDNFDSENKIALNQVPRDGVKLTGVVLERLKTKPGRDFYDFFYSQFLYYDFKDTRTVVVEEIISRGRNTKIEIKIDNVKIYEFFVQPKIDYLKSNATTAIKLVYSYFNKKKKDYIVRY